MWNEYAPTLNQLGLLETLDRIAFAMLCDAVAGYLRIREELSHEELVLRVGEAGYPTPNPLAALMRGQTKAVRELLSDFGMTPSSRTSLTGSTSINGRSVANADPLAELLKRLNEPVPKRQSKPAKKKPAKRKATPPAK